MKHTLIGLAILLFAAFSLGATCRPVPTPIEPLDTADCHAACVNLRNLGCVEGQPLEDGTSCREFCEETQRSGHALRPKCVMKISMCVDIDKCSGPSREIFE